MSYLFLALALVCFGLTGSLPNLAAGSSLGVLACVWACGEAGETEYADDCE